MIPEFSYAEYVWASYGVACVVVLWQAIQPARAYKRIVREITDDEAFKS